MNTEDLSIWRMAKALQNKNATYKTPPIQHRNATAITDDENAEMFADSLEEQFSPNDLHDPQTEALIENYTNAPRNPANANEIDEEEERIEEATEMEVTQIIKLLKNRKAPGRDDIPNLAIKNLPDQGITRLTNIINKIMTTGRFPEK